jgi:histidyl-tRNA synthetase
MAKATLARGMRDFMPEEVLAREYIFDTIRNVYRQYGFLPLETPVIESLEVLTGKYGEEGDKLLFKVLNSGEYLSDVGEEDLSARNYKKITPAITEKGLRYDLTVPLARYVAMHRNELAFPFKRYQIDKVWRADRPQKGRYREFYQCDGDIIGSYSMLNDAECLLILDDVLTALKMPAFTIKINNRKVLQGIAEEYGFFTQFKDFAIAIDKWDKIGEEGVVRELASKGFTESQIHKMQMLFRLEGDISLKVDLLEGWFQQTNTGKKGLAELRELMALADQTPLKTATLELDFKLARGLDYYTSTIYEVVLNDYKIGSIASGGRYDELTAGFGLPDMPGVGVSFGAERIYDVMKELGLLPKGSNTPVKVLLANFGGEEEKYAFGILQKIRQEGIAAEMFPQSGKLDKQFKYATKKGIESMLLLGTEEKASKTYPLKDLATGTQESLSWEQLIKKLKEKKGE